MFRPINYPGLKELEGTYLYNEIPKRLASIRLEPPHPIKKTAFCKNGGKFLFEGQRIKERRQRVFRCPLHNDLIILPAGFDWQFIRILEYGKEPLAFSGFWQKRFPISEVSTLPYPQKVSLGRVNLGQYEPYPGIFIAQIVPLEERLRYVEERAKQIEERAKEIEEKLEVTPPEVEEKPKISPWLFIGIGAIAFSRGGLLDTLKKAVEEKERNER